MKDFFFLFDTKIKKQNRFKFKKKNIVWANVSFYFFPAGEFFVFTFLNLRYKAGQLCYHMFFFFEEDNSKKKDGGAFAASSIPPLIPPLIPPPPLQMSVK